MTTKEIASKWAEYVTTGQSDKAYQELYSHNCVSLEMDGAQGFTQRAEGMEAIAEKGKMWNEMVEEFHGMEVEGPIVAGNHFTAVMKMDIKMKGQERKIDEEIGVFQIKDGKIIQEKFYYDLA